MLGDVVVGGVNRNVAGTAQECAVLVADDVYRVHLKRSRARNWGSVNFFFHGWVNVCRSVNRRTRSGEDDRRAG